MPVESKLIPVGSRAPDFTLPSNTGEDISLSGYRGSCVVLVFLRGFM